MSIVYYMVPMALVLGGIFVGAFVWAVRRGQFDDLKTPAFRMLLDSKEIDTDKYRAKQDSERKTT